MTESIAQDPRFNQIKELYIKKIRRCILISGLLSLGIIGIKSPSISITLLYLWIFFTLLSVCIPYSRANTSIKELMILHEMEARGMKLPEEEGPCIISWPVKLLYISLMIITFYPIYYIVKNFEEVNNNSSILTTMTSFAIVNYIFLYFSFKNLKQKKTIISMNDAVNEKYHQLRKTYWVGCWIALTIVNNIFSTIAVRYFRMLLKHYILFLIATYLYVLIARAMLQRCSRILFKKALSDIKADNLPFTKEDSEWIWGMVYYNASDSRVIIKSRFIFYYSINHARTRGRILNSLRAVAIISGLFLCIWSIFLEYTPIRLTMESQQIVASQLRDEYTIPFDDIEYFRLLEELPIEIISTDFQAVSKGEFVTKNYGSCYLLIRPQNTYFIYIKTTKRQYLLSSYDDDTTIEFYDILLNMRK